MNTCMQCGTEITAENYNMNWTLMCNSCHAEYCAKSKKKREERKSEARIAELERRVAELEKGAKK